jgi:hypothetical protein
VSFTTTTATINSSSSCTFAVLIVTFPVCLCFCVAADISSGLLGKRTLGLDACLHPTSPSPELRVIAGNRHSDASQHVLSFAFLRRYLWEARMTHQQSDPMPCISVTL